MTLAQRVIFAQEICDRGDEIERPVHYDGCFCDECLIWDTAMEIKTREKNPRKKSGVRVCPVCGRYKELGRMEICGACVKYRSKAVRHHYVQSHETFVKSLPEVRQGGWNLGVPCLFLIWGAITFFLALQ